MPECFFAVGSTLANMTNIESIATGFPPPTVNPLPSGGKPMPLMGGVGRRVLSGKLRRDGNANGAWVWNTLYQSELNALWLALYGDFDTPSRQLYISTIDATGSYSPFLCYVDCAYPLDSYSYSASGVPVDARFDLVGGVLQSLTKAATYSVTTADHLIYFDTSGGSRTANLFDVATAQPYVIYSVVKTSASNSLVIDPSGAQTIDGASTKTVTAINARVNFYTPDNAVWRTI